MENTTCTGLNRTGNWAKLTDSLPWYDRILCLLIVVAIVGNALIIYIQSKLGGARIGGASTTNRLIICLATADLLTAVFIIPIPELVNVPQNAAGEFYCRVIEPNSLAWIFFMGSVYTLTAISLERYIAIVHPNYYKIMVHRHYVIYAFSAIWIAAVVINVFSVCFHAVGECGRCESTYPSTTSRRANGIFLFLIEYVGPLCIMGLTNYKSVSAMRREHGGNNVANGREPTTDQSPVTQKLRRRLTLMFTVIVVTFMVLWLPDQFGFLLYNLGALDDDYTSSVAYHFFLKIAFINSAASNPFMYSLWMPVIRRAIKDLLRCRGLDRVIRETQATTMYKNDSVSSSSHGSIHMH